MNKKSDSKKKVVKAAAKKQKDDLDDLSDLVSELKNTKSLTSVMSPPQAPVKTEPEKINEDNIDDFIYRKSSELIQQGVDTIDAVKDTVLSGADADTIDAYSKLMNSVASSIEILNKINLQKRKETAAKELKQMDIDTSKRLMDKYEGGQHIGQQTNILVASREEVMKALVGEAKDIAEETPGDIIDVEPGV
jgi:hypothetical protein